MSRITRVEIHAFEFDARNTGAKSIGALSYAKGAVTRPMKYAVRIETADGCRGEYVTHWVASASSLGQTLMLAPRLIGRDAREREGIYDDLKRETRQFDHMGYGPLDIALWDWAGKQLGCSVATLLGAHRRRLPVYASIYHGDRAGGFDSKEAFAAFAEQCYDMGYRAFKLHGWNDGNAREEAGYFWYEDPYRDSRVSAFAHAKLPEKLITPLLMTEHVRGIEPKADFAIVGGHRLPAFGPGIRHGDNGRDEDRPSRRGARPRRRGPRLWPSPPPRDGGDAQLELLRAGAGRAGLPERRAVDPCLRLQ